MRNKNPLVYQACLPIFDRALTTTYSDLKKSGVQLSTFLVLYRETILLVCDEGDISSVCQHSNDLQKCESAVCRLVNASRLGGAMLSCQMSQLSAQNYSSEVDKCVKVLKEGGGIGVVDVKQVVQACAAIAKNVGVKNSELRDRHVLIKFLGADLTIICPDLAAEVQMKVHAVIKEKAWGLSNGLSMLPYEQWILEKPGASEMCAIDEPLLIHAEKARRLCVDLVRDPRIGSFSEMRAILMKKAELLCGMDHTFHLELAWLETAGESLERAVLAKTLSFMPTETKQVSFLEALTNLAEHRKSDMVQRASLETRERVASVETVVHDMSQSITPQFIQGKLTGFYQDVLNRSAFFFVLPRENGSSADVVVTGKKVVDIYVKQLNDKTVANSSIALGDIEKLRPFWFLLSAAQLQIMTAATKHAVANAKNVRVVRAADSEGESRASKAKKTKTATGATADTTKAAIMKFFA